VVFVIFCAANGHLKPTNGTIEIYRWHPDVGQFYLMQSIDGIESPGAITPVTMEGFSGFIAAARGIPVARVRFLKEFHTIPTGMANNLVHALQGKIMYYALIGDSFQLQWERGSYSTASAVAFWRQTVAGVNGVRHMAVAYGSNIQILRNFDSEPTNPVAVALAQPTQFTPYWNLDVIASTGYTTVWVSAVEEPDINPRIYLATSDDSRYVDMQVLGNPIYNANIGVVGGSVSSCVHKAQGLPYLNGTWLFVPHFATMGVFYHVPGTGPTRLQNIGGSTSRCSATSIGEHVYVARITGGSILVDRMKYSTITATEGFSETVLTSSSPTAPGIPSSVEYIAVGGKTYLLVGCCTNVAGPTKVLDYDTTLDTFQLWSEFNSGKRTYFLKPFVFAGEQYVIAGNSFYVASDPIAIYKWDTGASNFVEHSTLVLPSAQSAAVFEYKGKTVAAFTTNTKSVQLYEFDSVAGFTPATSMNNTISDSSYNYVSIDTISRKFGDTWSRNLVMAGSTSYQTFRLMEPMPETLPASSSYTPEYLYSNWTTWETPTEISLPLNASKASTYFSTVQRMPYLSREIVTYNEGFTSPTVMFVSSTSAATNIFRWNNATGQFTYVRSNNFVPGSSSYTQGMPAVGTTWLTGNKTTFALFTFLSNDFAALYNPTPDLTTNWPRSSSVGLNSNAKAGSFLDLPELGTMFLATVERSGDIVLYKSVFTPRDTSQSNIYMNDFMGRLSATSAVASVVMFKSSVNNTIFLAAAVNAAEESVIYRYDVRTATFVGHQIFTVASTHVDFVEAPNGDLFVAFKRTSGSGFVVYKMDSTLYFRAVFNQFQFDSSKAIESYSNFGGTLSMFLLPDDTPALVVANSGTGSPSRYMPSPVYRWTGQTFEVLTELWFRNVYAITPFYETTPTSGGAKVLHLAASVGTEIPTATLNPNTVVILRWIDQVVPAPIGAPVADLPQGWNLATLLDIGNAAVNQIGIVQPAGTDESFLFLATNANFQIFRWNGVQWNLVFTYNDGVNFFRHYRTSATPFGGADLVLFSVYNRQFIYKYDPTVAAYWSAVWNSAIITGIVGADLIDIEGKIHAAIASGTGSVLYFAFPYENPTFYQYDYSPSGGFVSGASTARFFKHGNDTFMIFGCCYNAAGWTEYYRWNTRTQSWDAIGKIWSDRVGLEVFNVGGNTFLVVLNGYRSSVGKPSIVYRFHPEVLRFYEYQKLSAIDATEASIDTFQGKTTLFVTTRGSVSEFGLLYQYQFNGTYFVESAATSRFRSARSVDFFRVNAGGRKSVAHFALASFSDSRDWVVLTYRFEDDEVIVPPTTLSFLPSPQFAPGFVHAVGFFVSVLIFSSFFF
jgi:hypothetical protein